MLESIADKREMIERRFENQKINTDKLLAFGFAESEKGFSYTASIMDDQFDMTMTFKRDGNLDIDLTDLTTNDSYILHKVSDAQGAFVGRVRQEYNSVLDKIEEACFETAGVFKSEQAVRIIEYVKEKYGDELQFFMEKVSE